MKNRCVTIILILMTGFATSGLAVDLLDPQVTESSGLAFSMRHENRVWTHNDSGDTARLFAFDSRTGQRTGGCQFQGMEAIDWESMAAYRDRNGVPRIMVADCGDNTSTRENFLLHSLEEPDPNQETIISVEQRTTLRVRHASGPVDCEAVAVDTTSGHVILISKGKFPIARVERLPLTAFDHPKEIATTEFVVTLPLPMITGLDIDPSTGDLLLASYLGLLRYPKTGPDLDLLEQLRGPPLTVVAPRVKQLEAVAFDRRGTAWITSEGKPVILRVSDD